MVVGHLSQPSSHRSSAGRGKPEQVEGQGPQRGPAGSRRGRITVLFIFRSWVSRIQCQLSMHQPVLTSCRQAFGVVRRLGEEKRLPLEEGFAMTLATDGTKISNNPATAGPGLRG